MTSLTLGELVRNKDLTQDLSKFKCNAVGCKNGLLVEPIATNCCKALFCKACYNEMPVQRGDLFVKIRDCSRCLKESDGFEPLKDSDAFLSEQYFSLKVICEYCDSWDGTIRDFDDHVRVCEDNPKKLANDVEEMKDQLISVISTLDCVTAQLKDSKKSSEALSYDLANAVAENDKLRNEIQMLKNKLYENYLSQSYLDSSQNDLMVRIHALEELMPTKSDKRKPKSADTPKKGCEKNMNGKRPADDL